MRVKICQEHVQQIQERVFMIRLSLICFYYYIIYIECEHVPGFAARVFDRFSHADAFPLIFVVLSS